MKLLLLIFLFLSINSFQIFSQTEINPYELMALNGEWSGVYTYMEAETNKPTSMEIEGQMNVDFQKNEIYWQKNFLKTGNTAIDTITFSDFTINEDAVLISEKSENGWILVTERDVPNNELKKLRHTYTISKDLVLIRQDRLLEGEKDWSLHSEYLLDKIK